MSTKGKKVTRREFLVSSVRTAAGVAAAELIVPSALDVDETATVMPERFNLSQNYPNPFNPTTMIQYDLPEATQVAIMIYDLMGREVRTLVNSVEQAGYKTVLWDSKDSYGQPVSGGIYIYHIQAGEYSQTKKMVLLK